MAYNPNTKTFCPFSGWLASIAATQARANIHIYSGDINNNLNHIQFLYININEINKHSTNKRNIDVFIDFDTNWKNTFQKIVSAIKKGRYRTVEQMSFEEPKKKKIVPQ